MPDGPIRNSFFNKIKSIFTSNELPESQREYIEKLESELEATKGKLSTREEKTILRGLVKLGTTNVKQIMRPRLDVAAINYNMNYEELQEEISKVGFSRLPVYKESIDKLEGILNIKDLFPFYNKDKNFNWQSLIRPTAFIPESKPIEDLLREFQLKHFHMALVLDEYGGLSGIVTLEDILEEIVGEIQDEYDEETLNYSRINDNTFIFEAKTPLVDFYKALDIDASEFEEVKGESESLGGLILSIHSDMPSQGEEVRYKNYIFTIEAADHRRIKMVKVEIINTDDE